jgi:hypothetical protein
MEMFLVLSVVIGYIERLDPLITNRILQLLMKAMSDDDNDKSDKNGYMEEARGENMVLKRNNF